MLAMILISVGFVARIITHEPNFTPILAIALFSGVYLNKKYAIILPVVLMITTDFILGLHETVLFTWGSLILIAGLGFWVRQNKKVAIIFGATISSSVLFFAITNFGVWLTDLYPTTWTGLIECFTLAIPFFRNTLLGTIVYSAVLFGCYEYIALRVKNTRLATVLLTN